ncbi:MAG TPA: alpha-1,4-glucan--maltose-1-phosphate maltosyltransferase [Gemmatimonadota bacterium]|nr:alpha-1,4-glucan--maltose-1-phosphate maltosyltransferase [Gemmatimonadota bacterium]
MVTQPQEGRRRVVIEGVEPRIDDGRHAIKRVVGDRVSVRADVFADGHDAIACRLLHRPPGSPEWAASPMSPLGNDRWEGSFRVREEGEHRYVLRAWIDRFGTWREDLRKRAEADQPLEAELRVGAGQLEAAAARARGAGAPEDAARLEALARTLAGGDGASPEERLEAALDVGTAGLVAGHPDDRFAVRSEPELRVTVERERARFSAWYELFPRSWSREPGRHGTLADVRERLPYVRDMGFDVLYLPPIHPIGRTNRKGPNNEPGAGPDDPGSPWAIGASEGGHKAVHPELGTLEDFRDLARAAREQGMEVALDLAYQCSPDHPYVQEHPGWFRHRPDGTIRHAENPPKKYEDIVPFDFQCDDWRGLWDELLGIVTFWMEQGVRIFRVDNPHTKPFRFWEWLIAEARARDPGVLFLSEAFTRPRVMYRLAKLGMSQSYTYFTWRNTGRELREYMTELVETDVAEFFRPNLWPNTPDILHEFLQTGGPPAFRIRAVLAATLSSSWGVYGPAFELCERVPLEEGSEEYLDSEKYQIREWDLTDPGSLAGLIGRVNRVRRDHPAFRSNRHLRFHETGDPQLLAYSRRTPDRSDQVLVVVNMDPFQAHGGAVELDLEELGIDPERVFHVEDLLDGERYAWQGARNYVELDPAARSAHLFRVVRDARSERDSGSFA